MLQTFSVVRSNSRKHWSEPWFLKTLSAPAATASGRIACVAEAASFAVARRLFGYYLNWSDLARIAGAAATMSGVLIALPMAHTLGGLLLEVAAGVAVYGAAMAALYPEPARWMAGKAGALLARR